MINKKKCTGLRCDGIHHIVPSPYQSRKTVHGKSQLVSITKKTERRRRKWNILPLTLLSPLDLTEKEKWVEGGSDNSSQVHHPQLLTILRYETCNTGKPDWPQRVKGVVRQCNPPLPFILHFPTCGRR